MQMVASSWNEFGLLQIATASLCSVFLWTLWLCRAVNGFPWLFLCVPLTLKVNHKCLPTSKAGLPHKMTKLQASAEKGKQESSIWPVRSQSFTLAPQRADDGPAACQKCRFWPLLQTD